MTSQEVKDLIEDWKKSDSQWDDYGFCFSGNAQKIHWISSGKSAGDFQLEVDWDNEEVINTQSLVNALSKHRAAILEVLK